MTIQRRPETDELDESYAAVDGPWKEIGQDLLEKIELGADERFKAQQLSTKYDTRWRLRYRPDMDPELVDVTKLRRLIHHDRVHDIVSATMPIRYVQIDLETISKVGP